MIRRVLSVGLFFLGGWILLTEVLIAFFDLGEGSGAGYVIFAIFLAIAAAFLVAGAWASPGKRWREMGLTILIAAGLGAFCMLTVAMVVIDPSMKPFLPADMPKVSFALPQGIANLLLVAGLGVLQYRTGRRRTVK